MWMSEDAFYERVLIWDPVLIRGNTVFLQNFKEWYTYDAHFEVGGGRVRQKWNIIGRSGVGGGG